MSSIDSILSDPEIAKLNHEIKNMSDSLAAYQRVLDNATNETDTITKSIQHHTTQLTKAEAKCRCVLNEGIESGCCGVVMSNNETFLKHAGEIQQNKKIIADLNKSMEDSNKRKTRLQELVTELTEDIQLKRTDLAARINAYLNP